MSRQTAAENRVTISRGAVALEGSLTVPAAARGIVLFAHGSGSSRHSPRNRFVAEHLQAGRLGTLLFDLLTTKEGIIDDRTRELRFNIPLLAERLEMAVEWLGQGGEAEGRRLGCFGSSTGAAAALIAAADLPERVSAVVSRGGRPDLAGEALPRVACPTLLIVGGEDYQVLELNRRAAERMVCPCEIGIVPGATHLFEEPGTLERAADLARDFFLRHLGEMDAATQGGGRELR